MNIYKIQIRLTRVFIFFERNNRMKTDFSIDINRKVELQNEIIKNFEEEKTKLLSTIESLEFEKDFDKKMNNKSIETAKALIDTMDQQIKALSDTTNEVNQLKEQYLKCIEQAKQLKSNYQMAMDRLVSEIKTELSLDNKQDKKRKLALLNRLKGRK